MIGEIPTQQNMTEPETPKPDPVLYPLVMTFTLTFLSGLFLAIYYIPTVTQAFPSVQRLNDQIPFGWFVRRIHGTGATFLLILMIAGLLRVLYSGDYKANPGSSWATGVLLLLLSVTVAFTGSLLPFSDSAFWGTVNVLSNLASIPWIGTFAVDLLRGGRELGGAALIRFYGAHIGMAAIMGFLLFKTDRRLLPEKTNLWNLYSSLITVGLLVAVATFLPQWFSDPLKEAANPMANPDYVTPPWCFIFLDEAVKYLTGAYPWWSGIVLILFLALLFLLPFIDRGPERKLLLRPMVLSLGAACLAVFIYFSLLGAATASYGDKVILPSGPLSPSMIRGAQVFAQKNCAYCHQVFGREGRREGPDILVVKQRQRSSDWVRRYILNARLYQPGTTMPRYEIPLEDLEALSAYLLAFDSRREGYRAVDRGELLDFGPYLYSPSENQGGDQR